MSEFEFLQKAFANHAEVEAIEKQIAKRENKSRVICGFGSAAIQAIIENYLSLRGAP